MTKFTGDIGLQFTIHIANQYTVPEIVRLAGIAHDQGFDQVWVNDNLGYRQIFVVLAAMASKVPIRLGSAILVPYFRNPVDLADSIATITELTDGRELSIGIARGAHVIAGNQVTAEKPLTTIRETVSSVKALLAGETVSFRDYPHVGSYFHLNPDWEFQLDFEPQAPVTVLFRRQWPKRFANCRPDYGWHSDRRLLQPAGSDRPSRRYAGVTPNACCRRSAGHSTV